MSSHANCTHEKTKAARAACRAGKAQPPASTPRSTSGLREKASEAASKLGEPKAEGVSLGRPASKHHYISGHCSTSNHDRCAIVYANTACTCPCHSES